jgi:hypothetical protein
MKETLTHEGVVQALEMKTDRSRSAGLTETDLLPGDHIYVKRKGRFYTHHGIYMGDGKVIHFAGSIREKIDPVVHETDLSRFLKDGILRRRDYKQRLPASETINIAREQLSDGSYSMIWNNCEHFATYCATGKKKSQQVKRVLSGLGTVAAGVALFVLTRVVLSPGRKP